MTPPQTASQVLTLGDADFDDALAVSDRAVLVDFHATWCPPCRALAPELERLAETHADRVRVATVDVDANPELVERFEIASVPSLLLMRGDVVLDRFTASTAAEVAARIEWLT